MKSRVNTLQQCKSPGKGLTASARRALLLCRSAAARSMRLTRLRSKRGKPGLIAVSYTLGPSASGGGGRACASWTRNSAGLCYGFWCSLIRFSGISRSFTSGLLTAALRHPEPLSYPGKHDPQRREDEKKDRDDGARSRNGAREEYGERTLRHNEALAQGGLGHVAEH